MSEQKSNMREELLLNLFKDWSGEEAFTINKLPQSGSNRDYFRIKGNNKSAIGVYNNDHKENLAFIEYSKNFKSHGLNVPEIYASRLEYGIYIQQDLGNECLLDRIEKIRQKSADREIETFEILKKVVEKLPEFQFKANQDLDYSYAYPRASFDRQSMHWDLSYFKYYFLKLAGIDFDEQLLENDYGKLIDKLESSDPKLFLFRDFQSRNIMLQDDEIWFIDYQGGRKGAVHYDLASMLFDAKADISVKHREELIDVYIQSANKYFALEKSAFLRDYYLYVLIRIMQAMGAYGFRGFYEGKTHFLKSIPYALNNLNWILENIEIDEQLGYLVEVLKKLKGSKTLQSIGNKGTLEVSINSFSYKKGIPQDSSGNGGGFVFDCRWIHNPGRYEQYKQLNGRDKPVIEFLDKEADMQIHMETVKSLVDKAVERFIDRGFTHLMVNFGCTGGQHRSVYSAERLARHLKKNFNIKIRVNHIEQNIVIEDFNI